MHKKNFSINRILGNKINNYSKLMIKKGLNKTNYKVK
jgi:hypothetical protein